MVKQGKKVESGLSFTDYVAQDFTAANQGRLAPIIALMRMLDEDLLKNTLLTLNAPRLPWDRLIKRAAVVRDVGEYLC